MAAACPQPRLRAALAAMAGFRLRGLLLWQPARTGPSNAETQASSLNNLPPIPIRYPTARQAAWAAFTRARRGPRPPPRAALTGRLERRAAARRVKAAGLAAAARTSRAPSVSAPSAGRCLLAAGSPAQHDLHAPAAAGSRRGLGPPGDGRLAIAHERLRTMADRSLGRIGRGLTRFTRCANRLWESPAARAVEPPRPHPPPPHRSRPARTNRRPPPRAGAEVAQGVDAVAAAVASWGGRGRPRRADGHQAAPDAAAARGRPAGRAPLAPIEGPSLAPDEGPRVRGLAAPLRSTSTRHRVPCVGLASRGALAGASSAGVAASSLRRTPRVVAHR